MITEKQKRAFSCIYSNYNLFRDFLLYYDDTLFSEEGRFTMNMNLTWLYRRLADVFLLYLMKNDILPSVKFDTSQSVYVGSSDFGLYDEDTIHINLFEAVLKETGWEKITKDCGDEDFHSDFKNKVLIEFAKEAFVDYDDYTDDESRLDEFLAFYGVMAITNSDVDWILNHKSLIPQNLYAEWSVTLEPIQYFLSITSFSMLYCYNDRCYFVNAQAYDGVEGQIFDDIPLENYYDLGLIPLLYKLKEMTDDILKLYKHD